jgi:NAD(P)-dependent dehydrogenase (short-subunit alcohol dehydrogenase family)
VTIAVIAGASPGLGSALAAALTARDYRVFALGRAAAVRAVAEEVRGVEPLACELASEAEVDRAFAAIGAPADAVVYNAHRIRLAPSAETSLADFEAAWRAGCLGAFVVAQRALPAMLARRRGALVFSGATSSVRAGGRTLAFGAAKFALRGLAQAYAREHGPSGIHVAHVVLDGIVWQPQSRARFPSATEAGSMAPRSVAAAYVALIEQDPSAWTHELDLRPAAERF